MRLGHRSQLQRCVWGGVWAVRLLVSPLILLANKVGSMGVLYDTKHEGTDEV
jgi:hypothetical protein